MTHIRTSLPPLTVLEPQLGRNYSVGSVYGAGDANDRRRNRSLRGAYGAATLQSVADYYNTQPFGDGLPLPAVPPAATPSAGSAGSAGSQRGFYHQEFAWPRCWSADERDTDTPDTVVSSSSPECVLPEAPSRFPGLRLIRTSGGDDVDDMDSDWDEAPPLIAPPQQQQQQRRCQSPDIPLCAPIPIRLAAPPLDQNREGLQREQQALKARFGLTPAASLKDASSSSTTAAANVTVTLTLNASAAEDVTQVLCRLAALLRVPPPAGFQIIERTTTPPSQRLGLYRFKRNHFSISIQTALKLLSNCSQTARM